MSRNLDDWERELSEAPLGIGGFNERTMRKIKERVAVPAARKNKIQPVLAGAMVVLLLASGWWMRDSLSGWFVGKESGENVRNDAWEREDVVLKIQYPDRTSFMDEFGLPFVVRHPNAQIEVPPYPESTEPEDYKKWLLQYEPDLLQVPLFLVDPLSKEGLIQPLDAWAKRDGFELDDFHAPVIRTIREAGDGDLYGLTPYFETYALYYNKSLFGRFGIAPPQDRMTWNEVLELAARFNGQEQSGQPIYGLTTGWGMTPFGLIQSVGKADRLRLTDAGLNPTVDSASWRSVWDKVIRGYRDGWIFDGVWPSSDPDGHILVDDLYKADPFLTGHAAMTFRQSGYRQDVFSAAEQIGFRDEWGLVTQPVSSDRSDAASEFSISTVYAINAKSPNKEAAWALLRFMTGPEQAQSNRSKSFRALSSRPPASEGDSATGEGAFYKLNVDSSDVLRNEESMYKPPNPSFLQAVLAAGGEEAYGAIKGSTSLEQAMSRLQKRAEELVASTKAAAEAREENKP
ncbi:ABC transporter substrate-binding protein [Cohnella cellulosilytica]|uniref:ABC transporter substrate-binding protein n=1 Tax=Cohnella cellulosilytica TaxID=986710 RepID=A0ABW2FIP1_9BACL